MLSRHSSNPLALYSPNSWPKTVGKLVPPIILGPVVYINLPIWVFKVLIWLFGIVSKNNCGISVKPGDPNKIADAIRKLSSDPNLRNEMRSSSRKVAVREFNRSTILEQFYDYLKKKSDY